MDGALLKSQGACNKRDLGELVHNNQRNVATSIDALKKLRSNTDMKILSNPYRGVGLDHPSLVDMPFPLSDASKAQSLLERCPHAAVTPLLDAPVLAKLAGVAKISVKDERNRMGLGSFKALGAAHVIAREAADGKASGQTYVTASAGNHGLSVAAGAQAFGAKSRVYISEAVPQVFAERLETYGAKVVRVAGTYMDSMNAAAAAAEAEGLILLSDSSWSGYSARPHVLMEGYLVLMAEVVAQISEPPSHIFLQAGVGGLAAAAAAHTRAAWGDQPKIIVVEPEAAPALIDSIVAAAPVVSEGPVSIMGRLDCKEPSLIALKGLARDADAFVVISEDEAAQSTDTLAQLGLASTPSGTAGLAAVMIAGAEHAELGLDADSRVLAILSEAPEE